MGQGAAWPKLYSDGAKSKTLTVGACCVCRVVIIITIYVILTRDQLGQDVCDYCPAQG